jgi:excisionase family DNA binding protein
MGRKKIKKGEISPDLRMLTTKEVASVLRVGVDRVRDLIKQGEIKAYVHFGSLRLPIIYVFERDLKTYLGRRFLSEYMPGRRKVYRKPKNLWK